MLSWAQAHEVLVSQANGGLRVGLALLSSHRVALHVVDDEEGIITLWPYNMLLQRSRTLAPTCCRKPQRETSVGWRQSSAVPDCVNTPPEELTLFPALTRLHRNSTSSALGRRCLYDPPAHQHSSARKPRYLLKRHEVECCHYVNIRPRASMAYDDDRSKHCWSQPLSAQGG